MDLIWNPGSSVFNLNQNPRTVRPRPDRDGSLLRPCFRRFFNGIGSVDDEVEHDLIEWIDEAWNRG
ncbi:MAG: hypothetical protein BWY82_02725 [Verrucomicrobia bacterium ADurb.Bin474]|nr:MAG: hypothetical protein BWY82_02725 [Verrucomicrobia bacterium ADurb.Bin474]